MNPTSLDKQSGAADDEPIVRIVRLETQMDNVTEAILSLQRTQAAQHQAMMQEFAALRERIDTIQREEREARERFEQRMAERQERFEQHIIDRLERSDHHVTDRLERSDHHVTDRLDRFGQHISTRLDRLTLWVAGLVMANVLAVASLFARIAVT
ncbi:hypothetical protein [Duganella sp. BuS-21]|uniref:hypothetical protein n=1 Tax=Duganella sp. BuS-21 TaxID=2943848 RepID=UPI0035A6218F